MCMSCRFSGERAGARGRWETMGHERKGDSQNNIKHKGKKARYEGGSGQELIKNECVEN